MFNRPPDGPPSLRLHPTRPACPFLIPGLPNPSAILFRPGLPGPLLPIPNHLQVERELQSTDAGPETAHKPRQKRRHSFIIIRDRSSSSLHGRLGGFSSAPRTASFFLFPVFPPSRQQLRFAATIGIPARGVERRFHWRGDRGSGGRKQPW